MNLEDRVLICLAFVRAGMTGHGHGILKPQE